MIGSNGGLPWRHDLVRKADVVFYVGCSTGSVTTEKWTLPRPGDARFVQLDVDPGVLGRSYPLAAGMRADAREGLAALTAELHALAAATPRLDPAEIASARRAHRDRVAGLFASNERPIRPERLLAELLPRLPERAIILADPGTPCPYFSACWRLPRAGRWFVSPRAFGALGYALPAVVGAHFARPDAGRVIGVMGDGSFGISAGELETLVRLDLPVTLIVCNNAGYGWIKAGQKSRGSDYFSVDFKDSDHAAIARAYGLRARRVEDPAELGEACHEALTTPGPVPSGRRHAAAGGSQRPGLEMDRVSPRTDIISGGSLFVVALAYGFGASGLASSGDADVALVPIGLAAALALLSAGIALSGWRKLRRERAAEQSRPADATRRAGPTRAWTVIGLTVVYATVFQILGLRTRDPALHRGGGGTLWRPASHHPGAGTLRDPPHLRAIPGGAGRPPAGGPAGMNRERWAPNVRASRGAP